MIVLPPWTHVCFAFAFVCAWADSASDYHRQCVLMNAVDTGWVTDNAPGGLGPRAKTHSTHVAPPLDEIDGAARCAQFLYPALSQMFVIVALLSLLICRLCASPHLPSLCWRRVLDPIFMHVNEGFEQHGLFWKNYQVTTW